MAGTVAYRLIASMVVPGASSWPLAIMSRRSRNYCTYAAVVSAEAFFTLTDLARLTPEDAIASLVRPATAVTAAALGTSAASSYSL